MLVERLKKVIESNMVKVPKYSQIGFCGNTRRNKIPPLRMIAPKVTALRYPPKIRGLAEKIFESKPNKAGYKGAHKMIAPPV